MKEVFELRHKPELKMVFNENEIEIIDISRSVNSGFYAYEDINEVEFNKEQIDEFVSILSRIIGFFIGGSGDNYKNKAYIKLRCKNKKLKIWLNNADINNAKKVVDLIKNKISKQKLE